MRRWLRRIRSAVVMGLIWAMVWAPAAVIVGMIVDPDGSMDEMWVAIGAYPGFLGGVAFATVLGIAARGRRFESLSISRFALWGAVAGFLVGTLPFTIGISGTALPVWIVAAMVIGTVTVLSALSAAGSLAFARIAERRGAIAAGDERAASSLPAPR